MASEEQNAALRQKRASDPAWREDQNEKRRAYKARIASGDAVIKHRVEPQEEGAPQRDLTDFWVMCWRRLNSEDQSIVDQTRLNVRKHFEKIANANAKARAELNETDSGSEGNGLGDDF